jgi:hypothetical protein
MDHFLMSWSARPRSADVFPTDPIFSQVPEADISQLSFYDFVGAGEDRWRNGQPERLRSVEVDDKLKPRRLLDRQIGRLGTSEDLSDVNASLPKGSLLLDP